MEDSELPPITIVHDEVVPQKTMPWEFWGQVLTIRSTGGEVPPGLTQSLWDSNVEALQHVDDDDEDDRRDGWQDTWNNTAVYTTSLRPGSLAITMKPNFYSPTVWHYWPEYHVKAELRLCEARSIQAWWTWFGSNDSTQKQWVVQVRHFMVEPQYWKKGYATRWFRDMCSPAAIPSYPKGVVGLHIEAIQSAGLMHLLRDHCQDLYRPGNMEAVASFL
jgi:hypothetical protein